MVVVVVVRKVVAAPHSRICPSLLPPTLPTADCLPKGKEHHQQTETLPVMDKNTLHHPHHHVQQVHYNKNKKNPSPKIAQRKNCHYDPSDHKATLGGKAL